MSLKLRALALKDLIGRYAEVWRHAWAHRSRDVADRYRIDEAQFLPAALALQETPVSPVPRIAMALLCSFAALALLWACYGRIDIVATAQGKVVPSGRTKTIQSLETSVVQAIHVSEGQAVEEGQLLVELDATGPKADRDRLAGEILAAKLQAARAQALLIATETGAAPRLILPEGIDQEQGQQAERWLNGQHAELAARLSRLQADAARRHAEYASTTAIVKSLEESAPIERQRAKDFKELVDQNFVSKHAYLEREQARLDKEGSLSGQQGRLAEISAGLLESKREQQSLVAEARRQAFDSQNEALQRSAELEQELRKAETRIGQMHLVSPVKGTVQQLAIHTIGGVVTSAQPLMLVVPDDQVVEVEAFLENKDVGFVEANDAAEVKFAAFQYTKYGTVHAKVVHVSNDAISDEKRGLIYSVKVKLDRSAMQIEDKLVSISPGMEAVVEVKTGRRRVIEYFLSPLIQHQRESLRER